ncbi:MULTISPECIES: type I polyketide synthase [unclassified Solwaraspora]|uniref:type I polyketide synthase n=1 Tax=unclassified Solwaraspora TaxID=2627926 RepID=UPI00248B43F7|nr:MULTISPECIES: type I polyketide synthase [unclassified Solwaraspora]WBB95638.1 SDR family NAD(P)-dependent oxidoreductase [Solwaraspora sp. WMMA2059]WBC20458.1 SDR family NAD(P)-dependent oxidoreductase [Solwaraspora sp. WMMA2080]WJK37389.1 SDR family NAD(P)-dependent oxidoreductase [Solwaraspora sp. WMMA2065]
MTDTVAPSTAAVRSADLDEPIAVVGVGLRFPGGCDSLDDFDAFLRDGRSGIVPLPVGRWDVAAFTPAAPGEKGKIHTTGGGFLERIDHFDAGFFNISPKEAQYIDPQQRMLLETAWQALENANIDPTPLRRGNGGVYVGASSIDYALEISEIPYAELDGHLASGITMFPLSGRLSYFLGWRGPSLSVDTACSSSLTALHLAASGLRRGECDIALCAGVNALHHPRIPVIFSHGQMLAPDGQCKTFDESADGYVRAEGCGVLVLKRLSSAIADGDTVLAVVRGTAVGQDGDSAGLTVPNGAAQEQTIRTALAAARLRPADIQYVEAHGTGTPLGDPIEMGAINDVFAESRTHQSPVLVGSVKTNLGHMEPASGIVGLIKVVLQMRSATIYPHLNLRTPSGRIPWDSYPVRVPTECQPWSAPVRRAVVNSFGFAGTIAVAVLEQAPARPAALTATGPSAARHVFTISAKNHAGLTALAQRYQRLLAEQPEVDLARLCYTTNVGRTHFGQRLAGVAADRAQLDTLLAGLDAQPDARPKAPIRKVAFMFTGQGAQYAGMGAALYRRFPVFRNWVDQCDELFAGHLGRSVRALLLDEASDPEAIDQTWLTQPALFTLELALARLWLSWGIRPSVLIGHSIGEVVAAAVAGLITLPDAVTLVAVRGRLMQSVSRPGGMAAVHAEIEEVEPLLAAQPELALAAHNSPTQCVVSGAVGPLEEVIRRLSERGVRVDRLAVSHAFHSPLMAEIFDEFRAALDRITFQEPDIAIVSNVTGAPARFAEIGNVEYWVRHVAEPVQFLSGIRSLVKRGRHAIVEIGPAGVLTAQARQCVNADDHVWVASLSRRDRTDETTLRCLAALYSAGIAVDWRGLHDRRKPTMSLPTYQFQRRRHWLPAPGRSATRSTGSVGSGHHPLLGRDTGTPERREFTSEFSSLDLPLAADHVVNGEATVPASAYVELLLAVQEELFGQHRGVVRDLVLHAPLILTEQPRTVHTRCVTGPDGTVAVEVLSVVGDAPIKHLTALVEDADTAVGPEEVPQPQVPAVEAGAVWPPQSRDGDSAYLDLASVGRVYGPLLRRLEEVLRDGASIAGRLTNRRVSPGEFFPIDVLEAALQGIAAVHDAGPAAGPLMIGTTQVLRRPRAGQIRFQARLRVPVDATDLGSVDLWLFDGDRLAARLHGIRWGFRDATRQRFFTHRLSWLRAQPDRQVTEATRRVLVMNAEPALAEALREAGTREGVGVLVIPEADGAPAALAESGVTDVAWFWRGGGTEFSMSELHRQSENHYRELLRVIAALDAAPVERRPRLWLVTRGAQMLPGDEPAAVGLCAASLWGFGPVLLTEYPQYRATLVDLAPAAGSGIPADLADPADLAALVREWSTPRPDDFQVAFRNGRRFVRRLLPGENTPPWPGGFVVSGPDAPAGAAARYRITPAPTVVPGPGQIEVLVDVVVPIGPELTRSVCAGTVSHAPADREFRVGDVVVVSYEGEPASRINVSDAILVRPGADAVEIAAGRAAVSAGQDRLAEGGLIRYGPDEVDEVARLLRDGAAPGSVALALTDVGADASATPGRLRRLRADRTYVITGGLGGLGLVTGRRLVEGGARQLVLVSRSGRATPEAESILAELRAQAEVTVLAADISQPADVADLAERLRGMPHPVGGFVHAAGAVGKELIAKLDWPAIEEQFGPKVFGGWLLHELSLSCPEHEFFVIYSSIAAVIGGATQAHYAGASAFLDALATWRRALGLPGLSLSWGAWGEVGMSARLDAQLSQEVDRSGVRFFSPARALDTLTHLWDRPVAHRVVGEYDWDRIASALPLDNALYSRVSDGRPSGPAGSDLLERLLSPEVDRSAAIGDLVRAKVAQVLHLDDPSELDPAAEFVSLGLDSLMTVEIKSGLESALRIPLPASLTFDHPSVQELVDFLDRRFAAEYLG